ncbi:MAG: hypothetical protein MPN21_15805 [Thermoanaerobaculia bacterium]|nr:hypothetical protein [Thermoanaerobaculia bacterium]
MIERRKRGVAFAVFVSACLLPSWVASQEAAPLDDTPRVPFNGFFPWAHEQLEDTADVMLRWGRGEMLEPRDVRRIFAGDFDPRPSAEIFCIQQIERGLVEHLGAQDPHLMLPLTFWQLDMLSLLQAWTGEPVPATSDFDRVEEYLTRYRDGASRRSKTEADRDRVDRNHQLAQMGVGLLYLYEGTDPFMERADRAFTLAVDTDPAYEVARYLWAYVREKIRAPIDVLRLWRGLSEDYPDNPEYRLRYGLVARRAERLRRSVESLEVVARDRKTASEWMRLLAYEEWVQALLESSKANRVLALTVLEEARGEFPKAEALDLLTIFLDLRENRRQALGLAERLESRPGTQERSPRFLYELPQREKVEAVERELEHLLRTGRAAVVGELQKVEPVHFFKYHVPRTCQPVHPSR